MALINDSLDPRTPTWTAEPCQPCEADEGTMGRLRAGDLPSPGYFEAYQLKTSRSDCSKSEEEGKYVEHGDTRKLNDGIVVETESKQLQGASLCRTGLWSPVALPHHLF